MTNKKKMFYILILSALVISVVFLPTFAFCAELGDFGGVDERNYVEWANGQSAVNIEFLDLTSFDLPITDISTKMPYSDSEDTFSSIYLSVDVYTYFGKFSVLSYDNAPFVNVDIYDLENDPDMQDLLAIVTISFYQDPSDPHKYAYSLEFDNIAGLEELETDTTIDMFARFTMPPSPPPIDRYWEGYDDGYDTGLQDGIEIGKMDDTVLDNPLYLIRGIFVNLGVIFGLQLFPGITLGTIVCIPLIFMVLSFILHIVRG